jgi:integron integrase
MMDVREPIDPNSTRFVDQLRRLIRKENLSYSTEKTYVQWILRFIRFHNMRHPKDMGRTEVENYLQSMASPGLYSQSTQRIALNAFVFLYRHFFKKELGKLTYNVPTSHAKVPVVFSRREVNLIISRLTGKYALAVKLLYGAGLRISEVTRLRIKDIDFDLNRIIVCEGKGNKDRITLLPKQSVERLKIQISIVSAIHGEDLSNGHGGVYLPYALNRLYPTASKELCWQFLFPAKQLNLDKNSGKWIRHHIDESALRRKIKLAIRLAGINKPGSAHSFRHSFATHMLQDGCNIKKLQELMGHSNIQTTAIYTQTIELSKITSPMDTLLQARLKSFSNT